MIKSNKVTIVGFLQIKPFLLILFVLFIVSLCGLLTEPSLGDEVYHWILAKEFFETGKRVTSDAVFYYGYPVGHFYSIGPLWHAALALLWKLTGEIRPWIAQLYHTVWLLGLLVFTWMFTKQKGVDREAGWWTLVSLVGFPMVAVFSILLYPDLPGTCLSICALWLITRRQYAAAGLIWGLTFLTRRPAAVLPVIFLVCEILLAGTSWAARLRQVLIFFLPGLCIIVPEIIWGESHIRAADGSSGGVLSYAYERLFRSPFFSPKGAWQNQPLSDSQLMRPLDLIRYLGIAVPLVFVFGRFKSVYTLFRNDLGTTFTILGYLLSFH